MKRTIWFILLAAIGPITFLVSDLVYHKEYYLDKATKQKFSFYEAMEALKNGNTIHRNTEYPVYYIKCEYTCNEKMQEQFMESFMGKKFTETSFFKLEDVLASDWIIE